MWFNEDGGGKVKIKIELLLKKKELPLDYHPIFVSLIKKCLSDTYLEEFENLYSGTKSKDFTFSVKMNKPYFVQDKIILDGNKVVMMISLSDYRQSIILYNSFKNNINFIMPLKNENEMELVNVRINYDREVNKKEILIRFLSPLVIRNHKSDNTDIYYTYNDEGFFDCFNEVLKRQVGNAELKCDIEPVLPKKTVVKCFKFNIPVSLGIYKLSANPEVLNYLYNSGMGSRRNEGFGMFEIIG